MTDYVAPGMDAEFIRNNIPKANAPSGLPLICVGRAIQIEKDVYLGAYTTAGGLESSPITGILTGATLINDDEISVSVQMDADASIVEVPAASWTRVANDIAVASGVVKELVDKTGATDKDGTLSVTAKTLSSVTVAFDEIGMVTGYGIATLIDQDDLVYPAEGVYDVGLTGSALYFSGASIPPEVRLTLADEEFFVLGAVVTQAVTNATGTIVSVDTPHKTILVGAKTGTFTASANLLTCAGGGSSVISKVDVVTYLTLLPEVKLTLDDSSDFILGVVVTQAVTNATGTVVQVDTDNDVIILGGVTGTFTASANHVTCPAPESGDATVTSVDAMGLFGFDVSLRLDGTARVSYKALRTDYCGLKTLVTTSTLLEIAGNEDSIVPENEVIWAAKIATDESEYCYITGVDDLDGWVHDYDADASAWNEELALLKMQSQADCAYQYLICSENPEVHAYLDLFLSWMRLPAKSKLALGWSSFKAETMDYVLHTTAVPTSHGATTTFTDASKTFSTLGLIPGGYVLFHNPADAEDDVTIRVIGTTGNDIVLATAQPATMNNTWTYEVVNAIYTLDEIANAAKVYAEGYCSRALRFAWNSRLDMKYKGVTYTDLPRYFWYAHRAAILSKAADLSQTFTREDVTGLFVTSEIPFHKGDDDRLDVVASGGVDIIMQDAAGRPLYSRDALTTDMTDNITSNQSVTHQYDYLALVIFTTFRPWIGNKKINKRLLALMLNMFGAIQSLLKKKQCLETLSLISMVVDPDDNTRVLWELDGTAIMPFKRLSVKIYMN